MEMNRFLSIRKGKKAIAFTFLAFFFSMILFAVIFMNFFEGDYEGDNVFKEARITYVNEEIKYFKQTYLPNSITYSLYNVLHALENYSRVPANYKKINQNYTKFNELILEGIVKGEFDGVSQSFLVDAGGVNKTLDYFIDIYRKDFYDIYNGNFTFEILDMNIYEEKPYYVSAIFLTNFSITTQDNISKWDFVENIKVSVPIFDLLDPEFLIQDGKNVSIVTSEFNLVSQNWTFDNFVETLNHSYSTVFFEGTHKYAIGGSFLSRFLNFSLTSYKDVIGFWSFDYDLSEGGVYDSAIYSDLGKYFGNTKLVMNFDNKSISGVNVPDFSAYNNSGVIFGDVNCSVYGVYGTGCFFDGKNDYIKVISDDGLNITDKLSFSVWIKPTKFIQDSSNSSVFRMANGSYSLPNQKDGFGFYYRKGTSVIVFTLGNVTDSVSVVSENITQINGWTHFVGVYDGNSSALYQNGFLVDKKSTDIKKIIFETDNLSIGGWSDENKGFFNGTIDEFAIYSKALSEKEVGDLFKSRKVIVIDYVDTFHSKGVNFDGIDDYVNISSNVFNSSLNKFAIESWVKFNKRPVGDVTILSVPINSSSDNLIFLGFNSSSIIFNSNHSGGTGYTNLSYDYLFEVGKNYYIVAEYNGTHKMIYINGRLVKIKSVSNPLRLSDGDVFLGGIIEKSAGVKQVFDGIIDEVKIYSNSLSSLEVKGNYFNYDSYAKGCCNYLHLVAPEKFQYNDTLYLGNMSHSSRLFYGWFNKGFRPDITLWNISNITSYNTDRAYYNFIIDQCIVDAYNILDYQNENITVEYYHQGTDDGSCSELVRMGVY